MTEASRIGNLSAKPPIRTMTGIVAELDALLDGKKTLAQARGISRESLDSVYGVVRELWASGQRDEALGSLELLCLYDHENARYWQALGTCRQAVKDHLGAAAALAFAIGQSGEFDGGAETQFIECLSAAGQVDLARARLRTALEAADEAAAGAPWQARARLLQAQLAMAAEAAGVTDVAKAAKAAVDG